MTQRPLAQAKYLVAEAAVGMAGGIALILLISRLRGDEFLGEYVLFTTWTAIFQLAANLGVSDLVLRETGRDPDRGGAIVASGLLLCGGASLVAMLAMLGTVELLGYPATVERALRAACPLLLPTAVVAVTKSGFIARGRVPTYFAVFVPEMLVTVGVNAYWIVQGRPLVYLVVTTLVARTIASLALLGLLHRAVLRVRFGFHRETLRGMLGPLVSFSLISVSVLAFWRIDIIMLSKLGSVGAAGVYVTAAKFLEVLSILPASFAQSMFASLSGQFAAGTLDRRALEHTVRRLMTLVAPAATGLFVFAEPLVTTIFGPDFAPAAPALRILMLAFPVLAYDMTMAIVLQSAGHQRVHVYFSLLNITLNITLNAVLIPRFSILGACVATLVSISLSAVLHYGFIRRRLARLAWLRAGGVPIAAAVLLGIPAWILLERGVHFLLLGAGYGLVAGGGVLASLLRGSEQRERQGANECDTGGPGPAR